MKRKKIISFILAGELLSGMVFNVAPKAIESNYSVNEEEASSEESTEEEDDNEFVIQDTNLRYILGKAANLNWNEVLTKGKLKKIKEIHYTGAYAGNMKISSFDGLEQCVNLERIELENIDISEAGKLPDLRNLEKLSLNNCNVKSINDMPKNIKALYLNSNKDIDDISVLVNCPNLEELEIANDNVKDISVLSNFPNMKRLNLEGNKIDDFSYIENCKKIKYLNLSNTGAGAISIFNNVSKTESLGVNSNPISDASKPSKFSKLSQLRLDGDSIENIEPLSNLVELEVLTLNNNKIKDISCLGNLKKLIELEAGNNEIEDINVIRNFEKLERLIMPGNKIIDVSPMEGLIVRYFDLSNNRIFDFSKYNFKYELMSGRNFFYYSDLLANDQDVTLDIVTCNNVAKIKLPTLKQPDTSNWMVGEDYDKPEVSNISDNGVYDRKTSTITWNNITEDKQVNFEMKHKFPLEDPWENRFDGATSFEYSGKVNINIRVLS